MTGCAQNSTCWNWMHVRLCVRAAVWLTQYSILRTFLSEAKPLFLVHNSDFKCCTSILRYLSAVGRSAFGWHADDECSKGIFVYLFRLNSELSLLAFRWCLFCLSKRLRLATCHSITLNKWRIFRSFFGCYFWVFNAKKQKLSLVWQMARRLTHVSGWFNTWLPFGFGFDYYYVTHSHETQPIVAE